MDNSSVSNDEDADEIREGGRVLVLLLGFSLPFTNLLLVPSVQGTLPAFILAGIVFISRVVRGDLTIIRRFSVLMFAYFISLFLSLMTNMLLQVDPALRLNLIGGTLSDRPFIAVSVLTQMPYLVSCLVVYCVFRSIGYRSGLSPLKVAAWVYIVWGLYDWVFFFITGTSGDFITNRSFGYHTSSWVQTFDVLGHRVLRFKSLSGEPSMTVLVLIPLMYLFRQDKKLLLSLLVCSLLTFSLSVYACLSLFVVYFIVTSWNREGKLQSLIWGAVFAAILAGVVGLFLLDYEFFHKHFLAKAQGFGDSGRNRFFGFEDSLGFFANLDPLNMMFGIGFGSTYYSLLLRILIDCGVFGAVGYIVFCLKGCWRWTEAFWCIGTVLLAQALFTSELFYPVLWASFGVIHSRVSPHSEESFVATN